MEYEIWTRYLKVMRHRKHWTQTDLARHLGISRSQYSAIESGRSVVSYKHIYNLGQVFDVPLSDLLAMSHLELTPSEKKLFSNAARVLSPARVAKGQSSKRRRRANGVSKAYRQEHDSPNGPTRTSNRTADRISKQERGRPKGSRIIICMCERRICGRPGEHVQCPYCGAFTTMPRD